MWITTQCAGLVLDLVIESRCDQTQDERRVWETAKWLHDPWVSSYTTLQVFFVIVNLQLPICCLQFLNWIRRIYQFAFSGVLGIESKQVILAALTTEMHKKGSKILDELIVAVEILFPQTLGSAVLKNSEWISLLQLLATVPSVAVDIRVRLRELKVVIKLIIYIFMLRSRKIVYSYL